MAGLPSHVLVRNSEEKGSDVNLATRLLLVDGFNGDYEQAAAVVLTTTRTSPER